MVKKDLDWLIEATEKQVENIIRELDNESLEPRDKRSQRAVLIQAIGSLQKLYVQAGIANQPSQLTLEERIRKVGDITIKRG